MKREDEARRRRQSEVQQQTSVGLGATPGFERLVYPPLGSRQIDSIKRSEIVRLLDKIEDQNGPEHGPSPAGVYFQAYELARRSEQ